MNKEIKIDLGRWTVPKLNRALEACSHLVKAGRRIDHISRWFLGVTYGESTLIGSRDRDEEFVINLGRVDCFTFIEYVEAMRRSHDYEEFVENLRCLRYREGVVSFYHRNHFFTDWPLHNAEYIEDITRDTGGHRALRTEKVLNMKEDNSVFLQGIPPVLRELWYLPASAIDGDIINTLFSGDYAGIYSTSQGVDVSHVGIIIKEGLSVVFRHASAFAHSGKVVDVEFQTYISNKPGLILLRPYAPAHASATKSGIP